MDVGPKENISIDQSEERWDVFYEELCRRIDHQIDENTRLEDQALFILRIILATIGLILTAFSVLASTGNISSIFSSTDLQDISNLATDIVTALPYFSENQSELVAAILAVITIGYFVRSIFYLFIQVPRYSYHVLQPTVLEPASAAPKMEIYYKEGVEMENVRYSLIEEYSELAESNREKIESTRYSWENCYRAMKKGTISFGIAFLFGISILMVQNATIVLILLAIFIWFGVNRVKMSDAIDSLDPLLVSNIKVDFSLVFFIFTFYFQAYGTPTPIFSENQWQLLALVSGFSLHALVMIYASNEDPDRIKRYAIRTYGCGMLVFFIMIILSLGTSLEFQLERPYIAEFLTLSSVILVVEALVLFFIGYVKESAKRVSSIEFDNLASKL